MEVNGSWNSSADYFSSLQCDEAKIAAVVCYLLVLIVGNPLLLVVIWYEQFGRDRHRTLLNQLISHYLSYFLASNVITFWMPVLRVVVGVPFPHHFCFAYGFLVHYSFQLGTFTAIESMVLRLLYTFYWRNVGAINDEFFAKYLFFLNNLLALQSALLALSVEQLYRPDYFICTGIKPRVVPTVLPDDVSYMSSLSTLIHIFGYMAIHFHKKAILRREAKALGPGASAYAVNPSSENLMSEGTTLVMMLLFLASMGPYILMIVNSDNVVKYPVSYVLSLCLPNLVISIGSSVLFFATHKDLRRVIGKKISDFTTPLRALP